MTARCLRYAAAALAAVVGIAACGSSPTENGGTGAPGGGDKSAADVYQRLNKLPADQQQSAALKTAKKEGGTLSLYTSYDPSALDAVTKGFQKQFGIRVKAYRAHSEDVLVRVQQESQAGRIGVDAVETNFLEMANLADLGVFAEYHGANLDRVPKGDRFGTWNADRLNIFVPVWNTDIIKPGQEPHSWADLASPRFDGKLVLEQGDYDWFTSLTLYWQHKGKSKAEIDKLWKGIVDHAKVAKGHTGIMSLLSAGQTGLFVSQYSHIAQVYVDKDAPVTYRSANGKVPVPGFPRPQGVGIMKGAPHPATAWLFAHWLLSTAGQQILADVDASAVTNVPGDKSTQGITLAEFPTQEIHKNDKLWSGRYDALLRGVAKQH